MATSLKISKNRGFNYWRSQFWTKIVPHDLMIEYRDSLPATICGRVARKILYPPELRPHYDWFNFSFEDTHLYFLKDQYYSESYEIQCSWEQLAKSFKKAFPEVDMDGDKYDGIALSMLINDHFKINP